MILFTPPQHNFKICLKEGKRYIFDPLRKKYVALTPEEWVRQNFTSYLIDAKSYPSGLIANEVQIAVGTTKKRCDTVIYDRSLRPRMIVEYKAPTVDISQSVFDQIVRYNMTLHVEYLTVTNGRQLFCCRIDYDRLTYEFLPDLPDLYK